MPVVLTDKTNSVWAIEQPDDNYLHVGWSGQAGPRLIDVLEFVSARQKQFDQFAAKKRAKETRPSGKLRKPKRVTIQPDHVRVSED